MIQICDRCGWLDDQPRGRRCACHRPCDPLEVRARHEAAVAAARASDEARAGVVVPVVAPVEALPEAA